MLQRFAPAAVLCAAAILAFTGCGNDERASNAPTFADPSFLGQPCEAADACGEPLAICIAELPDGLCTVSCRGSNECPGDGLCFNYNGEGICLPACSGDESCRDGYECVTVSDGAGGTVSACQPAAGDGPEPDAGIEDTGADAEPDVIDEPEINYGAACDDVDECVAGGGLPERCLSVDAGYPGGYCSATCTPGIDDCEGDALCYQTFEGGRCLASCEEGDCRRGYSCCEVDGGAVCAPEGLIAGCGGGGSGPQAGEVGASCEADGDCDTGDEPYCGQSVPGGYCTSPCETRENCGEGNWCVSIPRFAPFCGRGCEAEEECVDGQVCCDFGEQGICLPGSLCNN